jgi:site-specific DNA-methyltransferase (adenine-specific)
MANNGNPAALVNTRVIDCGDNLEQLKKLPDQCVDLVFIEPPFHPDRMRGSFWKSLMEKLSFKDCPESTPAYIHLMQPRCEELARVLKPSGSLYYHCDWRGAHHVRQMLNQTLGSNNFIAEDLWKRHSKHPGKPGFDRIGTVHDTLLLYSRDAECYFQHRYHGHEDFSEALYSHVEPVTGRRYKLLDLTASQHRAAEKGFPQYEFLGVTRAWRYSEKSMRKFLADGRIVQLNPDAEPQFKRYLDEIAGVPVGSAWDGIPPIQSHAQERLTYPTKEPMALLERIIEIASQDRDVDLMDSRGYGTALVAALNPTRQWIGIGHFSNVLPHHAETDNAQSLRRSPMANAG